MPFSKQNPRTFNITNIERLDPNQDGVYGLYKKGTWIYIGKGDIRQRLLAHLDGDIPCIIREQATHWVADITSDMDERERQLISEFKPLCNQRVG